MQLLARNLHLIGSAPLEGLPDRARSKYGNQYVHDTTLNERYVDILDRKRQHVVVERSLDHINVDVNVTEYHRDVIDNVNIDVVQVDDDQTVAKYLAGVYLNVLSLCAR